jgi:hypothetical protein
VTFVEIVCVLRSWVFQGFFAGFKFRNFEILQNVFRLSAGDGSSAGRKTEPPESFKTKKSGKVSEHKFNNLSRIIRAGNFFVTVQVGENSSRKSKILREGRFSEGLYTVSRGVFSRRFLQCSDQA